MKKKTTSGTARHGFLQGALILTAGMAAVKLLGALFKIPLKYAVGEYGMGLFNAAYNFYGPVFSLATAGLPVAVARLVSENGTLGRWNDVRKVKKLALPAFFLFGLLGMVLVTAAAPVYCWEIMKSRYALAPMLALAPAVLFACLASVYRGYYEGLRNMTPTAVSEVVEAVAKLLIGLSGACAVVSLCTEEYGRSGTVFGIPAASPDEALFFTLSFAAAAAILGVTCGSVFSLCYLSLHLHTRGDGITAGMLRMAPPAAGGKVLRHRLLKITLPIALGSIAMNVAGLIDATFLQSRLGAVMEASPEALLSAYEGMIPSLYLDHPETVPIFLYGCYTLALTIYLLVPAVTQAFGISALPNVTEAWTRGKRGKLKESMESVAHLTALFCFPAGLGISALALPISRVLYGGEASSEIVARALFLLGFASLAAAMCTPLSSMLQAVGRADLPVKLLVVAMGIKIAVNYFLCGIPEVNIAGAGVGTLCCYLFYAVSQWHCLKKVTGVSLSFRIFIPPLAGAFLCGAGSFLCHMLFSGGEALGRGGEVVALLISIVAGAALYVISLLLLRGFDEKEMRMLPGGQKIGKMLEKRG